MERCSLHPIDLAIVEAYTESFVNDLAPAAGRALDTHELTVGLAAALARVYPSFVHESWGLTIYEARVERGVGMYLRPPSRLFREAGLADALARRLPIRLEFGGAPMGGAFVPARLVPALRSLLDHRGDRLVRRLIDAEVDPIASLGLLLEACDYAVERNLGIYEATGVHADAGGVMLADRRRLPPERLSRLEAATRPPRKAGLLERLLRRDQTDRPGLNGHVPRGK
ncbi:MAG: hypothetical protein M3R06_08155 [Chloroflexota bacterium]|nr:hypothetical protein [Chloroflexota bacterium]